jgi:hypothetical protein
MSDAADLVGRKLLQLGTVSAQLDVVVRPLRPACGRAADGPTSRTMQHDVFGAGRPLRVEDKAFWVVPQPFEITVVIVKEADHGPKDPYLLAQTVIRPVDDASDRRTARARMDV